MCPYAIHDTAAALVGDRVWRDKNALGPNTISNYDSTPWHLETCATAGPLVQPHRRQSLWHDENHEIVGGWQTWSFMSWGRQLEL